MPATSGGSNARSGRAVGRRDRAAAVTRVGPAQFRSGGHEGPTDTVYLGRPVGLRSRRSEADETLIRNQDHELNWRLRQAGYVICLDPALVVEHTPSFAPGPLERTPVRPMEASGRIPQSTFAPGSPACGTGS